MSGIKIDGGILRIRAKMPTNGKLIINNKKLPIYILAISPQNKSGCWVINAGPGVIPWITKPLSKMALTQTAVLTTVVGSSWRKSRNYWQIPASYPFNRPFPNSLGCLLQYFSSPYDKKLDIVATGPGSSPTKNPTKAAKYGRYRPLPFLTGWVQIAQPNRMNSILNSRLSHNS